MFLPRPHLVSILFIHSSSLVTIILLVLNFQPCWTCSPLPWLSLMQRIWEGFSVQFQNSLPRHLHHDLRHLQTVGSDVDEVKIYALPVASGYIIDISP
jgi:hypothetical protein